jgi:DNA repair protein RadC
MIKDRKMQVLALGMRTPAKPKGFQENALVTKTPLKSPRHADQTVEAGLLARVLGGCDNNETIAILAARLIQAFCGLEGVVTATVTELRKVPGVTPPIARLLQAQAELSNALALRRTAPRQRIGTMSAVIAHIQPRVAHLRVETAHALFLNSRNILIGEEEIGQGTVNSVMVYPREVARHALVHRATAVVLAHNHPSGDVTPSIADLEMTEMVRQALAALDITLHDHLVIGVDDVFSFRSAGLMRSPRRARPVAAQDSLAL